MGLSGKCGEHLLCCVCTEIYDDPHFAGCGKHVFCRGSIFTWWGRCRKARPRLETAWFQKFNLIKIYMLSI